MASSLIQIPAWLRQMESILENLNEGVIIVDDQLRIIFANEALIRLGRYERDEIQGHRPDAIFPQEDLPYIMWQHELGQRYGRRRTQYHQSVLVAHTTPLQQPYQQTLGALCRYFVTRGFTMPDANAHAQAQLARIVQQQAALLGSLDCFWILGCACLIGAPLVFFTRKVRSTGPATAH